MKVQLNYFDRVSYTSCNSEIKRQEEIEGLNDIDIFEKFYKKNNSLRYCNGSYYEFQNQEWKQKYNEWLHSDDYKNKSFELYYGGGIVD